MNSRTVPDREKRVESVYYVVTFRSTHDAVRFEKRAQESGIPTRLIPVPRQISSNCGISARFEDGYLEPVRKTLEEQGLDFESVYRFVPDSRKPFERLTLEELTPDQGLS